jgi:hypothetical protein
MTRKNFDPMSEVPQNDEQAQEALRFKHGELGEDLVGIYRSRRARGATVLKAYEVALLAHLEAIEQARN